MKPRTSIPTLTLAATACAALLGAACAPTQVVSRPSAAACGKSHARVGERASFPEGGRVEGTATVIDDCTIRLQGLTFGEFSGDARIMGVKRDRSEPVVLSNSLAYWGSPDMEDATLEVVLPEGVSLDDFDGVALQCNLSGTEYSRALFAERD